MNDQPQPHSMPRAWFGEVARGGGRRDALAQLVAAQHSRQLILVLAVAERARQGNGPDEAMAVAGYELLARARAANQAAADTVISYPSVGTWALHILRDDRTVPGAGLAGLAAVAAAAAVRAGVAAEIEVPVHDGAVYFPTLGAAEAAGPTAIVRTGAREIHSAGRVAEMRPGAPGWQHVREVQAGPHTVLIDDLDPFRMPADDGEPEGRLATADVTALSASLSDAWEVLSPARAGEISSIVRVIVPYKAPESGHVSTSSPQSFGTIAMSRQPDRYTCAETLVHETQHLKLCALLDLVTLTLPDDGQRYYAPWRTDPRPASGLLQGAYAFLGVSGFWREQRRIAPEQAIRERAQAEFARWREGAGLAVGTLLDSGQLTPAGQVFVTEMGRTLEEWQHEPVSREALVVAQRKADRHAAQWHADNG